MCSEKSAKFVIVDTGCANLASVKFAVQRLGFDITISDNKQLISNAAKVILPGVGSARHAMQNIQAKGLVDTLQQLTQPVLGFCLGMQLMARSSVEGGQNNQRVPCLGVIPTDIKPLDSKSLRLPHMGWNTLEQITEHPIFSGITAGAYCYFVHSFAAPISQYTIAKSQYGSQFSAAIAKNNFIGCQFHPERSSKLGSKIIQNFLEM